MKKKKKEAGICYATKYILKKKERKKKGIRMLYSLWAKLMERQNKDAQINQKFPFD